MKPYLAYSRPVCLREKRVTDLTRADFKTDLDWIRFCCELGDPWQQIRLAAMILAYEVGEDRVIEAYMWLYLAKLLGAAEADHQLTFLMWVMSEQQVQEGILCAETWVENKWADWQAGNLDYVRPELKNFWGVK
jgi:hypothetical protein